MSAEDAASVTRRSSLLDLRSLVTDLIVREHSPAAVLTNVDGDIVYLSSRTGDYLEPAVGKANMNIFNMAREGLRDHVDAAYREARSTGSTVHVRGVRMGAAARDLAVDLTVQPLDGPGALAGMVLVVFRDVETAPVPALAPSPAPAPDSGVGAAVVVDTPRDGSLDRSLQLERDRHRVTRERMQAVQEELRSANEELQSTNEELQSTNEELSTSKEEMQSMNEELRTVNNELQAKMAEATQASDDMKNILNATDIAILFLDTELRVRRFTHRATDLFRLQPGDVGRPITDLATDLDFPAMASTARAVLETLRPNDSEVEASGDRWVSACMMPYRSEDNRIDGVVLTFRDITASKHLEAELRRVQSRMAGRYAEQAVELAESRAHVGPAEATDVGDDGDDGGAT